MSYFEICLSAQMPSVNYFDVFPVEKNKNIEFSVYFNIFKEIVHSSIDTKKRIIIFFLEFFVK